MTVTLVDKWFEGVGRGRGRWMGISRQDEDYSIIYKGSQVSSLSTAAQYNRKGYGKKGVPQLAGGSFIGLPLSACMGDRAGGRYLGT